MQRVRWKRQVNFDPRRRVRRDQYRERWRGADGREPMIWLKNMSGSTKSYMKREMMVLWSNRPFYFMTSDEIAWNHG